MTLLLTVTAPYGMVMAADTRLTFYAGGHQDGHRKIVPWVKMRAAVGFAGLATLGGGYTDQLLERHLREGIFTSLGEYASAVAADLDHAVAASPSGGDKRIYVHVAGFGAEGSNLAPEFHYVRNAEWNDTTESFRVTEDLRTTFLAARGIHTISDMAAADVFRVQFSGARPTFARRAQRNLKQEVGRLHDLRDVGNWAVGQIRAVASDLRRDRQPETVSRRTVAWILASDGVSELAG